MQFFPCSSSVARWPYLHREKSRRWGPQANSHPPARTRRTWRNPCRPPRESPREARPSLRRRTRRRIEHASFAWPTSRGSEAPVDVSNSDCLPVTRTASFDRTFQDANNDKSGGGEGGAASFEPRNRPTRASRTTSVTWTRYSPSPRLTSTPRGVSRRRYPGDALCSEVISSQPAGVPTSSSRDGGRSAFAARAALRRGDGRRAQPR